MTNILKLIGLMQFQEFHACLAIQFVVLPVWRSCLYRGGTNTLPSVLPNHWSSVIVCIHVAARKYCKDVLLSGCATECHLKDTSKSFNELVSVLINETGECSCPRTRCYGAPR
jgi:hypothetical protein